MSYDDWLAREPDYAEAACVRPGCGAEVRWFETLCADCEDEQEEEALEAADIEALVEQWPEAS